MAPHKEKVSGEPLGKGAFPDVACPGDPESDRPPPGAAGNTVETKTGLKPYRREPFGLQGELESESKREILVDCRARVMPTTYDGIGSSSRRENTRSWSLTD